MSGLGAALSDPRDERLGCLGEGFPGRMLLDEAARFFAEVVAPTNRDGDTIGSILNDDGTVTAPESFKKAYEQLAADYPDSFYANLVREKI